MQTQTLTVDVPTANPESENSDLVEYRDLVGEVFDKLHSRIVAAADAMRDALADVEDVGAADLIEAEIDRLDDIIASTFEQAAEGLDL
jgi:hypothetical protein